MRYGRYTMAAISSGPVKVERVLQHETGVRTKGWPQPLTQSFLRSISQNRSYP